MFNEVLLTVFNVIMSSEFGNALKVNKIINGPGGKS